MTILLVLGGGAIALIAPLGTTWGKSRLFNLSSVYERFPELQPDLINANVLAGALVLIIPIGISLFLRPRWFNFARPGSLRHCSGQAPDPGPKREATTVARQPLVAAMQAWHSLGAILNPLRLALGLALVLMLAVTALTQSRGAYAALAVGMLVLAMMVNRWFFTLSLASGLGLAAAMQRVGIETLADLLLTTDALGGWASRQEVWSRAIFAIQDFPYTGIGLGTFGKVVPVMYPYFLIGPDADISHAHNLFLQVAVDLGLPGLVAFAGLFGGALMAAWKAYRTYGARKEVRPQGLALGFLVSLLIMGMHGLTDSVTWGPARPAIIPWCIMGLTMALYRVSESQDDD